MAIKSFDPQKSIYRAATHPSGDRDQWNVKLTNQIFSWKTSMDRIQIIRNGLPYEAIEVISQRANLPVRRLLQLLNIPQTTYNKKKRSQENLSGNDTEKLLLLAEILDYGLEVFNQESQKFYSWLKKPNQSLGNVAPVSLFDSQTGIQEVKNCLNRLEYGNMA